MHVIVLLNVKLTNIDIILITQYRVTQKTGTFKNTTKVEEIKEKYLLTEIEPLQLAF